MSAPTKRSAQTESAEGAPYNSPGQRPGFPAAQSAPSAPRKRASSRVTLDDGIRAHRDRLRTTCACGARKPANHSLCRRHHFALPDGMRQALYGADTYTYPAAYKRALEYLKLTAEPKGAA